MRCSACSTENPPQAKFCLECAAPLAQCCSRCGTQLPGAAKFCMECAQPVPGSAPAVPASPDISPQAYTPRHLADNILANRAALEGERKQVTVLFADVVGSTELVRDLDPEDAQRLLDGATRVMMDAVHRYEGTVCRLMGDGLMALFGAPLAHEDHAVRACYAALAMQQAARAYADELRRERGLMLTIRVGLNSGEVVIRAISDDLHVDYSAMGQTVHLAARMEQVARPEAAALTAATLGLVEGYVEVRAVGPVPVKGLADPVEVYELVGVGAARGRLQAAAPRGLTPFVGRQDELAALHAALERAGGGRGQVVALVGEPGVGKSRLVWEVTHSHRTAGWTILEAGSVSYGKATAYLPVIDLLRAYCRIEPRDDARTTREKLTGKLLALDEELRPALPALLALLEVSVEDPAWQALDPPRRRRQTLDAVKRLLLRESREQPLVLVFEDLHWIDGETQALLDSLVESLPTARILLLVNYRPEYRHEWSSKTYYTQLRIDPLPPAGAEDLLGSLLGDDPSVRALRPLLIRRTEGNPFFLEETVRALVETGALVGERGAHRLIRELPSIRMPATVQAILAARIDRLAAEDKRLLQTAAVIGKDVPFALLRAVVEPLGSAGDGGFEGLPDELQAGLGRLRAAEFLYEVSLFPELEYTFKHALTHEVAYRGLLQERRRSLHARIAETIERVYPDRLGEQVEQLAEHAFRGELWDRAYRYLRQAGAKAAARAAYREAGAALERALAALEHLPADRERQREAIDLHLELRSALLPLGELERVLEHLREAEGLALTAGDQRGLGLVSQYLCNAFFSAADFDRAVAAGRRALSIGAELDDFGLLVAARFHLGQALHRSGDFPAAITVLRENLVALGGEYDLEQFGMAGIPSAMSRAVLAAALSELGEFDEAAPIMNDAVRIAEAAGRPYTLTIVLFNAGSLAALRGNLSAAVPLLERCLELSQTWDLQLHVGHVYYRLGRALLTVGRLEEGRRLLEQAREHQEQRRHRATLAITCAWLARACDLEGRVEEGLELARRAVQMARDHRQRVDLAHCLRLLADIQAGTDAAPAGRTYREALALAEELGMRPLQAHCHVGLGRLYRPTGRPDEARTELAAAVELYRAMEMTHWIPQAEAELAEAIASPSVKQAG